MFEGGRLIGQRRAAIEIFFAGTLGEHCWHSEESGTLLWHARGEGLARGRQLGLREEERGGERGEGRRREREDGGREWKRGKEKARGVEGRREEKEWGIGKKEW